MSSDSTTLTGPASETSDPATADQLIWLNGKLVPRSDASVSVFDHGLLYGDGVFEGIRVYNGRTFKCATHLDRLFASAEAIRLEIPYTRDQLTEAIRQTCAAGGRTDAYIRLCVTRGAGTLGLHPFMCPTPNVFVIADSIQLYPQELYDNGLAVIIAKTIRNHPAALSPAIKSMNYLNNILAKIEAIDAGVLEAIMLNHEGNVAECTGDNLFVVRRDADGEPQIVTPPASAGVLEGVTMRTVLKLADQLGLPTSRDEVRPQELFTADEIFLTGTAAEVIPVTTVDGRTIGGGKPGPITAKLIDAFRKLVAENAPED